jgi:hypothetical protein
MVQYAKWIPPNGVVRSTTALAVAGLLSFHLITWLDDHHQLRAAGRVPAGVPATRTRADSGA